METNSLQPASNKPLPEAHTGKPKKSKKGLVIGIIVFVIVVTLIVGGFFGYRYYMNKQKANQIKKEEGIKKDVLEHNSTQSDVVEQSTKIEDLKPVFSQ
ncbi:hypothetical protein H0W80_04825 [Candidatus Saccharibacteria bacterium]|nr:hypothetical protein [Candidatus Saccharibacteria bacterium]